MTELQGWIIIGLYVGVLAWLWEGIHGTFGRFLCKCGWHKWKDFPGDSSKRPYCARFGCLKRKEEK